MRDNWAAPMVPSGWMNQAQIASGVRIVLRDDASREAQLGEMAKRVALTIRNEVDAEQLGLHPYFNFRSQSEQTELKEPAWA